MGIDIGRRKFVATLGSVAAAWPRVAHAQQQPAQIPRVGWIFPGASVGNPTELAGFKEGLRELGYVEGRNIVVEYRFGENSAERLAEFATEFARLNVSVIVAFGTLAVRAVRRVAPDTAIVFLDADPIGAALVTNLSRPGGNITGLWVGIFAPHGTPPEIVTTLRAAIGKAVHRASSRPHSATPVRSSPISTDLSFRSFGTSTVRAPTRRWLRSDGRDKNRTPCHRFRVRVVKTTSSRQRRSR
jgi:hypothetical protein